MLLTMIREALAARRQIKKGREALRRMDDPVCVRRRNRWPQGPILREGWKSGIRQGKQHAG